MKGIFEKKKHFGIAGMHIRGFRGFPPMFHPHGELVYVVKGAIPTVVDGQEHLLKEGELGVIFPYLTHSYEASPEAEALVLLFDLQTAAFDRTLLTQRPTRHYLDGAPYRAMLRRGVELARAGKFKTARGYLDALLGELLEELPLVPADRMTEDVAVRILEYCAVHFSEPLTARKVAKALYISESYLSKIFARKLKYGFREYLNALRMEKAKSLLEHSEKRVVDVMYECGFTNQSSFNRVFRDYFGKSPKEFRQKMTD